MPITVAARSKAWTIFARSNAGILGSNPAQGMDVCVRLFCVCVVLCAGSGLTTGWPPVLEVLPTVYRIKKLKSGQTPTTGCRAITIILILAVSSAFEHSTSINPTFSFTSYRLQGALRRHKSELQHNIWIKLWFECVPTSTFPGASK
jgi:hypothetical protein